MDSSILTFFEAFYVKLVTSAEPDQTHWLILIYTGWKCLDVDLCRVPVICIFMNQLIIAEAHCGSCEYRDAGGDGGILQ